LHFYGVINLVEQANGAEMLSAYSELRKSIVFLVYTVFVVVGYSDQ
jgi:hypothetical protein